MQNLISSLQFCALDASVQLDGISSFCHINFTTQLGVIYKFSEGAPDPSM